MQDWQTMDEVAGVENDDLPIDGWDQGVNNAGWENDGRSCKSGNWPIENDGLEIDGETIWWTKKQDWKLTDWKMKDDVYNQYKWQHIPTLNWHKTKTVTA